MRAAWLLALLALAASGASAEDDPSAIAKDLSSRFVASCEAADVGAALALYEDDAKVVYPGEGARAEGKGELARVVAGFCVAGATSSRFVSGDARWLGPGHDAILASGEWETSAPGPDGQPVKVAVRTTEVLVRRGASWRYALDHASVGVPAPPAAPGR